MNEEEQPVGLLKMLCDLMEETGMTMVFWVCPKGCKGTVKWNKAKTDATCGVCGEKRSTPTTAGQ